MFRFGKTVTLNQQKKNANKKKLLNTTSASVTNVIDISNSNFENFQNIGADPSTHTIKANSSKISSFIGATLLPKLINIDLTSTPLGNEPYLSFMCVVVFGQNVSTVNGSSVLIKTKTLAKKYGSKVRPLILDGYLVKSVTPKLQIALYNKENEIYDFDFKSAQEFLEKKKQMEENEREIQEMIKQLLQQEKPVKTVRKPMKCRLRPKHETKKVVVEEKHEETNIVKKENEDNNAIKEKAVNPNVVKEETKTIKQNDNQNVVVENETKKEKDSSQEIDHSFEADEEFLKNERMFQEEEKKIEDNKEEENNKANQEEREKPLTIKKRTRIPIKTSKFNKKPSKLVVKTHKKEKAFEEIEIPEEEETNEKETEIKIENQIENKQKEEEKEIIQIPETKEEESLNLEPINDQINEDDNLENSQEEGEEELNLIKEEENPEHFEEEEEIKQESFKLIVEEEEEELNEEFNLDKDDDEEHFQHFVEEEEEEENHEQQNKEEEEPQFDNIEDLQNFDVNARNENGVQEEVDDFIASIQDTKKLIVVPQSTDYDIDLM